MGVSSLTVWLYRPAYIILLLRLMSDHRTDLSAIDAIIRTRDEAQRRTCECAGNQRHFFRQPESTDWRQIENFFSGQSLRDLIE